MADLILHPKRDASVRRRHPWLMSGAIASEQGAPASGELVRVLASTGEVLAAGHYSPRSQIRARLFAFGKDAVAALGEGDEAYLRALIRDSIARREGSPLFANTNALRLVNAEGDGLPGLTVDRYGECVVVKLTSAGMVARRDAIAGALREASGAPLGFERSDALASRREGLPTRSGVLWGDEPPARIRIEEGECLFDVDVRAGQKTGFYLDQRDARACVLRLARGKRVLDLFSYTGGFSVAAARGGAASVTLVDSSLPALESAETHLALNEATAEVELLKADAFEYVRTCGRQFDLLVVDPPPLARHKRDLPSASRAYKDLLLHVFRCAAPGAQVLAFSCSQHVGPDLFAKIAFAAALDARRDVRRLAAFSAAADHPVSLYHPESHYLSALHLHA